MSESRTGPLLEVEGVAGGSVLLPCDLHPPRHNDSTHLVLFYHGSDGTPIYSVDARQSSLSQARLWADPTLSGRATLSLDKRDPGLVLQLLHHTDHGDYRCRVDFLESPTRNLRIRLNVIVPPQKLTVTTQYSPDAGITKVAGPFPVAARLTLFCLVVGGQPRPQVTWWHEGSLLDNESEVKTSQLTRNALTLPPLTRNDLNKTLTCQASNSDRAIPLSHTVTLDVSYPAVWVGVYSETPGKAVVVAEGVSSPVTCQAKGSRPPARLEWWLDGKSLSLPTQVLESGEVSSSTVTLVAEARHHGLTLTCRATTPGIPHSTRTATATLIVNYKPRLQLVVEGEAALARVREGADVTFFCHVDAHPIVNTIHWARDGVPLTLDETTTVTGQQERLVLKGVTREDSGKYTCAAANSEGPRTSNTLTLTVMFPPRCSPGQQKVYGAARHEQLQVPCTVLAHPAPGSFRWAVNTSSGVVDVPLNLSSSQGVRSILHYTPQTHHDFGDLLCWAVNDLGPQVNPCVFRVIPAALLTTPSPDPHHSAAKPEPVQWCGAERNASMPASYVVLACVPGWDGGLNQTFTLEVRQAAQEEVLEAFRHASDPTFIVSGMKLGVQYLLTVTAANARGSSPPVTIPYTPKAASAGKVVSPHTHDLFALTPLLMAVGVLVVMVAACVAMGYAVIRRRNARSSNDSRKMLQGGPGNDDQEEGDVHTIVCVKDCEKEEMLRPPSSMTGNLYVTPPSLLNNCVQCGKVAPEETDDLLNDHHYHHHHLCVAPLASLDSLDCSSISTSTSKTSSNSTASRTTVTLNPNFLVKEPDIVCRNPDYLARHSEYLGRLPPHYVTGRSALMARKPDCLPPHTEFPPSKQSDIVKPPEYWEPVTKLRSMHRESSV
ncbi:hypothetical protein Pcinc_029150 [Petrolisthes cinctipes]|uniref:Uncharacterized protein n=1 Tax=Petrolisthes cinctipes TaxID=88211 RepID=A0AAE1F271_PETCI|nr:hypothetical protein Pcinc_029150 [Petrolisthes cinctipes]